MLEDTTVDIWRPIQSHDCQKEEDYIDWSLSQKWKGGCSSEKADRVAHFPRDHSERHYLDRRAGRGDDYAQDYL